MNYDVPFRGFCSPKFTRARDCKSGVLRKCIPRHVVEWPSAPQLKDRISSRLHYGSSWKRGGPSFRGHKSGASCQIYPKRRYLRACPIRSGRRGRMSTPVEFKDLFFLPPKLSLMSLWNGALVSLQGGGGGAAGGQRMQLAQCTWKSTNHEAIKYPYDCDVYQQISRSSQLNYLLELLRETSSRVTLSWRIINT